MSRPRKPKGRPIHGWLVIDKPADWTSADVVNKVRRHLNAQKAGHGGTLDPLATGLLALALGEATKTVEFALKGRKAYTFTLRFGQATATDDAEGEVVAESPVRPDAEAIRLAMPQFLGQVLQRPPAYSAIKIDGQRAYDLARSGEVVEIQPRPVLCHDLRLIGMPDADHAEIAVECGAGYYVRALARDLALALGTVGHVSHLRRDRVAGLTLGDAVPLNDFLALEPDLALSHWLRPIEAVLDGIPALGLTAQEAQALRAGQPVRFLRRHDLTRPDLGLGQPADAEASTEPVTVLAMANGRAVALAELDGPELRVIRVFNL